MKKLFSLFFILLLSGSVFATTISTGARTVYGPVESYTLTGASHESLFMRKDQLVMSVDLLWEKVGHPGQLDRGYRETVYLPFEPIVFNKATRELFFEGKKIGWTKEKCGTFGCYEKLYLDYDYEVYTEYDGLASIFDLEGFLKLYDSE